VTGKVVFPGCDSKFLISGVEKGNQQRGKSLASHPYKYHPGYTFEGEPIGRLEDKNVQQKIYNLPAIIVRPDTFFCIAALLLQKVRTTTGVVLGRQNTSSEQRNFQYGRR